MPLIFYIKLYFALLIVFLGIDSIWLTKVAPQFYKSHIGHLMTDKPFLLPALLFYLLFIIGILVFAVVPGVKDNSAVKSLVLGALFGLCSYGTYDLTNFATLKEWPFIVVVVDLLWGTFITATVSLIGYFIASKLK